jgi:plastocyanin
VPVTVGGLYTAFTPATRTINVGDRVVWTWDSSNVLYHTTTSGTPGSPDGVWDSDSSPPGQTSGSFNHTFNTPGIYHYYCRVHGAAMTGTITVLAPDAPPTASFTSSPANPTVGQAVTFDASASGDTDGDTIASYMWSFDGGAAQATTSATITHAFTTVGAHSATLTIRAARSARR